MPITATPTTTRATPMVVTLRGPRRYRRLTPQPPARRRVVPAPVAVRRTGVTPPRLPWTSIVDVGARNRKGRLISRATRPRPGGTRREGRGRRGRAARRPPGSDLGRVGQAVDHLHVLLDQLVDDIAGLADLGGPADDLAAGVEGDVLGLSRVPVAGADGVDGDHH